MSSSDASPPYEGRKLSDAQSALAATLAMRHELNIPIQVLSDPIFGRKFLDLFLYDSDKGEFTGYRRISVIENYYYNNKYIDHLGVKLELSSSDVEFMIEVLRKYKFNGFMPREDLSDPDPEHTAYIKLEEKLYDDSYDF